MGFHAVNEIGVRQFVGDFHTENCAKRMAFPAMKGTVSRGNCRNQAITRIDLSIVQKNGGFSLFYMPHAYVLQVGRTHRHGRTVVHVVDKDVDTAPYMFVRNSTFTHYVKHRGRFLESHEATDLPRCFRSVRNLQLFWNWLIVFGAWRSVVVSHLLTTDCCAMRCKENERISAASTGTNLGILRIYAYPMTMASCELL
jgi:hypothetical protein